MKNNFIGKLIVKVDIFASINKAFEENKELLEKLGSDYDENGVPYWDKND